MRGRFTDQRGLFSCIFSQERTPARHPFGGDPALGAGCPCGDEPELVGALCARGPPVDPAGAIAERSLVAGVLWNPLRAGLGRDDLHQTGDCLQHGGV